MLPELAHLVRRPFSFLPLFRKGKPQPVTVCRRRPRLEELEDRTLLSPLQGPQGILAAWQAGATKLLQDSNLIADQLGNIPLVNQALGAVNLDLPPGIAGGSVADDIAQPFQTLLNQLGTLANQTGLTTTTLQTQLGQAFQQVYMPDVVDATDLGPDSNGILIEVTWSPGAASGPALALSTSGSTGFSYFQGGSSLVGVLTGNASANVSMAFGVEVVSGSLVVFIDPSSSAVNVTLNGSGSLSGSVNIGTQLLNVQASATADLGISGSLTFKANTVQRIMTIPSRKFFVGCG